MQNLALELQTAIAANLWQRPRTGLITVDDERQAARSFQRDLAALALVDRALSTVARGQFDRLVMLDGAAQGEKAAERFRTSPGRSSGRLVIISSYQHGRRLMPQLRRVLARCSKPPLEYIGAEPYSEDVGKACPDISKVAIVNVGTMSMRTLKSLTAARTLRCGAWRSNADEDEDEDDLVAIDATEVKLPHLRHLSIVKLACEDFMDRTGGMGLIMRTVDLRSFELPRVAFERLLDFGWHPTVSRLIIGLYWHDTDGFLGSGSGDGLFRGDRYRSAKRIVAMWPSLEHVTIQAAVQKSSIRGSIVEQFGALVKAFLDTQEQWGTGRRLATVRLSPPPGLGNSQRRKLNEFAARFRILGVACVVET